MRILFYTFLFLYANAVFAQSESPDSVFARANQFYQAKKFSEAAAVYQQLSDLGYSSKELYYNLGNAYFKLHRYGYAIFNYEKSRQIDPSDEDNQFNLELAELYIKDKIATPPEFFLYSYAKALLHPFPQNTGALLCMVLLYLSVGTALSRTIIENQRFLRISRTITLISFSLLIILSLILGADVYHTQAHREAIILSASTDIKNEPDGGVTVFILHEGLKVEMRSEKDDWCEIKLKDGKVGWIKRDELGTL
jgi:tetratricopeptide (TPR) repeat protein